MRRFLAIALGLSLFGCGSRASSSTSAPAFYTTRCPLPEGVRGYPLVVTAEEPGIDPAWLAQFARVAAHRWQVPSARRGDFGVYRSVRRRILPALPRWADDWNPRPQHRAELRVTIVRDGTREKVDDHPELVAASDDDLFDRSLATIVRDPLPASDNLPRLPAGTPDTVHLRLRFGHEPEPGSVSGVMRFARQQRPVRVMPGSLLVRTTRPDDYVVVKYDVDAFGRYLPDSFEALDATSGEIVRSAQEGLERARFSPAQGECEAVELTVVQLIGRR